MSKELIKACEDFLAAGNGSTAYLERALQKAKAKEEVTINFPWTHDDIVSRFEETYLPDVPPLTEDEVKEVARLCKRNYDASIGMNWDVLDDHIHSIVYERDELD